MKKDWVIWWGCAGLFGAGVVWGLLHAKTNFFEVENIHDLFEIFAAMATIAAVTLAAIGVNAWRKQVHDTADHELARKILVGIYEYVEAIKSVRHPMVMEYEIAPGPGEKSFTDPDLERFAEEVRTYQRRLTRTEPIRAKLFSYSIEADAVWGASYKQAVRQLLKIDNEIAIYLRSYFISIDPKNSEDYRQAHRQLLKGRPNAMMDDLSEDGDEFTKRMMEKFTAIESMVREKLIR
ncbi:MAG TPA: hypothetical protein DGQ94_07235 [Pseudomonas sp.]|nr:hypothetical protein [Pseudomonas sp.]